MRRNIKCKWGIVSNKLKISYLFTNPAAALLKDISRLKKQPLSDERNEMLKVKLAHLISLQKHEVLGNKKRSSDTTGKEARNLHIQRHEKMRYMFYSKDNSKNRFLFADFFDGINPIDILEWKLSGWFFRTVNILYSPIMLFIKLMIPQINRESPKHGWCKLLNCLQIVIIPFVTICAVHCKLNNRFHAKIVIASCPSSAVIKKEHLDWYIVLNISYAKWSLFITLPLALYVFLNSRTDLPPSYHIVSAWITYIQIFKYLYTNNG